MSQQLITKESTSPFSKSKEIGGLNVGSVSIEQERAIAEAQGQLVMAKRFPRNETSAHAELMNACKMPSFAGVAFYSVPRAGGAVTGPSIRLAEEVARVYGNFEYGHRELARDDTKSEVEVYAWDKEKNNRSIRQITVYHVRDTKNGSFPLRDQKDIDDKIANVASKQVRGRILALMPKWLVEEAIQECRRTLAGNNDEPIESRIRKMSQAFAKFGVSVSHLEAYLGHGLDKTLSDEIVDLQGIYNAIREGVAPSDFFAAEITAEENEIIAAAITSTATKAKESAPAKAAVKPAAKAVEPEPESKPEPVTKTAVEPKPEVKKPEPEAKPEAKAKAEPAAEKSEPVADKTVEVHAGTEEDDDVF